MEPAFQADDSPETAAAGALPGIQHPPGYPLPTLLGRLASLGFPGNPAMSQNQAASFWACLVPALFFVILNQLCGDWQLSFILALGLGFMPQLGYQASSAKGGIYTLNLLLSLVSLSCFWLAAKGREGHWLRLGYLVFGAGLAGHYMSLVLFVPAIFLWVKKLPRKAMLWSLPGISLYLYLPLRSMQHPGMNWGDPESFQRFSLTLLRAQYAGAENSRNLTGALRLATHFFVMLPQEVPWPMLLLAVLGLGVAWKNQKWSLRPLIVALGVHWLAVLLYNNPPASAPWVIDAFFLPDFALIWLFSALGLFHLIQKFSEKRVWILGATALFIAWLGLANYQSSDYSGDYLAYDYARDLQALLPHDAILLAAGGDDAFGFWYLQQIEKRRQELTLLDVPLLSDWYMEQLSPRIPELNPSWQSRDAVVNGLLGSKTKHPLYYTSHNPGDRGIPLGLISLAPAPNAAVPLTSNFLIAPWLTLRTRFLNDATTPKDGNRAELMEYYPASARALGDFAGRFHNLPLQQFAKKMEQYFQ